MFASRFFALSRLHRCLCTSVGANPVLESSFLLELSRRGYINQCTDFDNLDEILTKKSVAAYLGFDATASSLHIGSLLQIMCLRKLQQHGHKPVILIGGGTTKIGDPSGKDASRQLLSDEVIRNNCDSISSIFKKFIRFGDGPTDAIIVNNADWLENVNYIDFLREYGSLFSVNRMVSMESVKSRLNRQQPLSFLEFNYMLLQSYDFVELNKQYDVQLQLGGSDQWGNIVSGIELGRRLGLPLFGLTTPLLTTSTGAKMGKSVDGAVWLNRELVSEYEYWQYWRNVSDQDVIRFLKLFTELPLDKIEGYHENGAKDSFAFNAAKVALADAVTTLLHGEDCLAAIHDTVASLYSTNTNTAVSNLSALTITPIPWSHAADHSMAVSDVLLLVKATTSKNEGRRLIKNGGVRVNGVKVTEETATISSTDFTLESPVNSDVKVMKLSWGKKKHLLIEQNVE